MILIGALAKIKDAAKVKYMPNEDEAILDSVSFSVEPRGGIPIRKVASREVCGIHRTGRQAFSITWNYSTNEETADKYFKLALEDAAKVTSGIYTGAIPFHSELPFVPIAPTSVSWGIEGIGIAQYSLTMEYLNLDTPAEDGLPIERQMYSLLEDEVEIDLRQEKGMAYEGENYQLALQYDINRNLDGYSGIYFQPVSLSRTVKFFDTSYEHNFKYSEFVEPSQLAESRSFQLASNGKLMIVKSQSGVIKPSTNQIAVERLF